MELLSVLLIDGILTSGALSVILSSWITHEGLCGEKNTKERGDLLDEGK